MANMLVIFGLVTYATKGVSFGAIEPTIPNMVIPKVNGFPTIILWAVAAIVIVWFIWNKTTFGKNLYAVGGNPEAAAVSGISVFAVTLGAFIMAGILYGFGSWLECTRMVGSGSAAYGQGWDMDAIAACVVGGVSFTGAPFAWYAHRPHPRPPLLFAAHFPPRSLHRAWMLHTFFLLCCFLQAFGLGHLLCNELLPFIQDPMYRPEQEFFHEKVKNQQIVLT